MLSTIGRVHLLRSELDTATEALDEAMARAIGAGWTAFAPWPESLRAEIDLQCGDIPAARTRLEHAFALGCQIGAPCWEGISACGLGRAAQGGDDGAIESLLDARRRASRLPDGYVWVQAFNSVGVVVVVVDDRVTFAVRDHPAVRRRREHKRHHQGRKPARLEQAAGQASVHCAGHGHHHHVVKEFHHCDGDGIGRQGDFQSGAESTPARSTPRMVSA